jgi:hypothetical protein
MSPAMAHPRITSVIIIIIMVTCIIGGSVISNENETGEDVEFVGLRHDASLLLLHHLHARNNCKKKRKRKNFD